MARKQAGSTQKERKLHLEIVSQMLQLATAGFGLAAALAWNDMVKTFIDEFIKPNVPGGSGFSSQFIYVIVVTVLAVLVTYQLSRVKQKFEKRAGR